MSNPIDFITEKEVKFPQYSQFWISIRKYINTKLWFQFTEEIQQLFKSPEFKTTQSQLSYAEIFTNLIQPFATTIDQYTFVSFALQVCNTLPTTNNYSQQFDLLNSIKPLINQDEFDALLLLSATIAFYLVSTEQTFQAMDILVGIETKIDATSQIIQNLTHFQFHKAYALVEQKRGQHLREFNHKLLMLSYSSPTPGSTDESNIMEFTIQEQQQIATEISVSALLSTSVYNFGEVLTHATIQQHTPSTLKKILEIFQKGDLQGFKTINLNELPLLTNKDSLLYRKLQVIALINHVFSKPAPERTFSFQQLQQVVNAKDEFDLQQIIIFAFGANVIRGKIDGIEKTVTFTWVQPRLLDQEQLISLRDAVLTSVDHTTDVIVNVFNALGKADSESKELAAQ